MSEREMCAQLLEYVPDFKLRYVLAYLQGLTADELDDDTFCEQLYSNYMSDPDRGETVSIDDAAALLGVVL